MSLRISQNFPQLRRGHLPMNLAEKLVELLSDFSQATGRLSCDFAKQINDATQAENRGTDESRGAADLGQRIAAGAGPASTGGRGL